jgi:dTMP kinase
VNSSRKGRFITLEGGEGAGKSTQILRLKDWLEQRGLTVVTTREPGGSAGAEIIRKLLVEGATDRWDDVTEVLLLFAARRDHLRMTIHPALDKGHWVICDRFADSTRAYQGYGHGFDLDRLDRIYDIAVGRFHPDLTLILDIPIETGLARAAARRGTETRYENLAYTFHQRVRAGFKEIARQEPGRCALIDAERDVDSVTRDLVDIVAKRLGL